MGISLEQYRACIGIFSSVFVCVSHKVFLTLCMFSILLDLLIHSYSKLATLSVTKCRKILIILNFCLALLAYALILLSGDIELNPGPRINTRDLSISQWNLNSVWVDDFAKIAQMSAFLNTHRFDIFCICESFLDSSIEDDDQRLKIDGYDFIRSDHPSDSKRGGVGIYYKSHLPLVRRKELELLSECLVCELKAGSDRFFLCLCYRSPSQDAEQFNVFKLKWEETVKLISDSLPTVSVFLGDFNARNSDWWSGDITNSQGRDISDLAAQYGLHQIIDELTHLLQDSLSCIDLIFSSVENLVTDTGVLHSLYPRCHHQIVFAKFSLKPPFPPAYQRRIWDFSRADHNVIKHAVNNVDWRRIFSRMDSNSRLQL